MIIKSAQLETVCGVTSVLPENVLPEIAFAGKSNVGKSSLINALLGRRKLARTSSSPGKTQTINFYKINQAFFLVDLPGYGYAKASAEAKAQWGTMIERYLNTSKQLKTVFLLVDIRHAPGENDVLMLDWIRKNGLETVIVATKADKLSRQQISRGLEVIREGLGIGNDVLVLPFSAVTKQGRDELLALMSDKVGWEEAGTFRDEDSGSAGKPDGNDSPKTERKPRWPKEERHKAARRKKKK